ncbi:CHY zinc finger protein [Bacillus sp. RO1]|uniref:CHY zinc finger protein n=1 Tax=Bacillus sp. RO1 TaxID=2722703 RepID=UPI001F100854|nr:CHY zinc finger protein [Bacillus sp. RO1]
MTVQVLGKTVDDHTRCVHYHSDKDIIAIKFHCCGEYYPCYQCHEEHADHPISIWPKEKFHTKAVVCGDCKFEMTIHEYLNSHSICPKCSSLFNSGCENHHHLYFEKK